MFRWHRTVYLDHNATTPPSASVCAAMERALVNTFANPSALHTPARAAAAALFEARQTVAAALGCAPSALVWMSGASEANNTVIQGWARGAFSARRKILSTPLEHPSVLEPLQQAIAAGMTVEWIPVDAQGRVRMESFAAMLDADTALVCCMMANNEVGTLQDVAEITRLAHQHGAFVLADGVQALGKIPVHVETLGVDYASFSAHKIYGPKGIGALYIRDGAPFTPLMHGGAQEEGRRAGTENVPAVVGFAAACADIPVLLAHMPHVRALRDRLWAGLQALCPDVRVNTPRDDALGNTLSVTFPQTDNALLLGLLDTQGIAVSAGSACHTQSNTPSTVLKALGLSDQDARQTLRLSLGQGTTARDIAYTLSVFKDFFSNRLPAVGMVRPSQLDEGALANPQTFILDVRFPHDRRLIKSLPMAREVPFFSFQRFLSEIPREKSIVVVCQAGINAPLVAAHLRAKGYRRVSFLVGGMVGWVMCHKKQYQRYKERE